MSDVMTIEEIKARYAPEWVLIVEPEIDEFQHLHGGRVAFHSPDRDAVYRKATELRPERCAFRYLGEFHGETIGLLIETEIEATGSTSR